MNYANLNSKISDKVQNIIQDISKVKNNMILKHIRDNNKSLNLTNISQTESNPHSISLIRGAISRL